MPVPQAQVAGLALSSDPELDAALADLADTAAQALSVAQEDGKVDGLALIEHALAEFELDRDPVGLAAAFTAAMGQDSAAVAALADRMGRTRDPARLFAMARAISVFLDADLARRVLASLESADAESRAVGWLALWGRTEPEVLDRMAAAFLDEREAETARATAARVLGAGLEHLAVAQRSSVLAASRRLLAPGYSAELSGEAAALLASAGDGADVPRILAAAEAGADPGLRMCAMEALLVAGAEAAELIPVLRRMAVDPSLPVEYRHVAQGALGLLERQP